MNNYTMEAKQRWGDTAAYREYEQRNDTAIHADGLMALFEEFAAIKIAGNTPDSPVAQEQAKRLQDYITAHFYTCTKEILAGLGQMYVADDRFRQTIDTYGDGTAEFVAKAIEMYCA